MKLLEEILSNRNMNDGYKRVYRNKGASGVDGVTVNELKEHLRENKDGLRTQIRKKILPMVDSGVSFSRSIRAMVCLRECIPLLFFRVGRCAKSMYLLIS
nr:hypothetical protein [Pueribacillus theae]